MPPFKWTPPVMGKPRAMNSVPRPLTRMIAGGSKVSAGAPIAAFDATVQMDAARNAQAKGDDLGHQADQKRAQNRADAERRTTDLQQAEADLAKAQIELRKGPVLSRSEER